MHWGGMRNSPRRDVTDSSKWMVLPTVHWGGMRNSPRRDVTDSSKWMVLPTCLTFRLVVVSLWGPGESPVVSFACCIGLLLSVSHCGWCSCWCRFCVREAQWLVCRGVDFRETELKKK